MFFFSALFFLPHICSSVSGNPDVRQPVPLSIIIMCVFVCMLGFSETECRQSRRVCPWDHQWLTESDWCGSNIRPDPPIGSQLEGFILQLLASVWSIERSIVPVLLSYQKSHHKCSLQISGQVCRTHIPHTHLKQNVQHTCLKLKQLISSRVSHTL